MKTVKLASFLACIICTVTLAIADNVTNKSAPEFEVTSGDDKVLKSVDLKGKVIVVFYETRDVADKNKQLKDSITALVNSLPEDKQLNIVRLPIINAADANWFTKGIWKSKFREKSEEVGLTVYGDWEGSMLTDFGFKHDDNNIALIDKSGTIKTLISGEVTSAEEIEKIKKLIISSI